MLKQSKESHGSNGKSAHANIDNGTYFDVTKDVYVPGEFRRPCMNINMVSMDQHGMATSGQMLILRQDLKSEVKND